MSEVTIVVQEFYLDKDNEVLEQIKMAYDNAKHEGRQATRILWVQFSCQLLSIFCVH